MARPIFNIADVTEFRAVGHNGQALGATRPDQSYEAGVFGEFAGPDGKPQLTRFLTRAGAPLDYWEGE